MPDLIQPHSWVAVRLPSENNKVIQVVPNTTISLGKYGSFPSNLIIDRPYHITYEILDKREGEKFSRLRVVPASEIHADVLAEIDGEKPIGADEDANSEDDAAAGGVADDADNVVAVTEGGDYTLVDKASGNVIARSGREEVEEKARQMLTMEEIEQLKKQDVDGGRNIIAKLMLSHTALGEKTAFSLAKYKTLKSKKYLRQFSVLPLHPVTLGQHILEDKDASKILDMRQESLALLGCWGNVHRGEELDAGQPRVIPHDGSPAFAPEELGRRYLVVDDTGGLVVAAMAERMGILWPDNLEGTAEAEAAEDVPEAAAEAEDAMQVDESADAAATNGAATDADKTARTFRNDFEVDAASANTITVLHQAAQPNLALLRYWGCDMVAPNLGTRNHPLHTHLFPISWLQLLEPMSDTAYSSCPADATEEEMSTWKSNKRGNYHRKRKRWAKTKFLVDQARGGGFSALVVASAMEPISILRNTLPLLAGGASVSIYSPTIEPLTELCDCFSITRRAAWVSNPPPETEGFTPAELERWEGSEDFPINPTLLLGSAVQTSRAKRWQVLPLRTHPLMMSRGGAEGYIFTGWKAVPAQGKVEARGKFKKRKMDGTQAP
ncbi:GCD10 protein [Plectosphaerella cucumerina]|uniref:tRNA (adenine(58)-N(1))-methyltransferase non-catalytic subunit TRM6 n=1 Tax=Plectosphaerella cucumerina TaxID=40658 RepID=A0A8K0T7B0_9PEZI|nr:GCD10 protein [Plectosphaerella cucumerina]